MDYRKQRALECLSVREREIAQLLIAGASYDTTARQLWISKSTVQSHAQHIYQKLEISSRRELIKLFSFNKNGTPSHFVQRPEFSCLSKRERQVAEHLATGKSRKETAQDLGLSPETIKAYSRTLYNKLGIQSRDELFELVHC